jgi:hypothetical protein
MSPSSQGGYTLCLPGFDTEAPAYPDLFAEAAQPAATTGETQPEETSEVSKAWRPALPASAIATVVAEWPTWDDTALGQLDGQVTKFEANTAAIAALRAIEDVARTPTASERTTLLRYTGWGGIPASFNEDGRDPAWVQRACRLRQLLSDDDHDSAKASVNNSHYTDPLVIHWIWAVLRRLGFQGGRILEPSAGIGHFLGCMPADVAERSRITAIEIDRVSGRILRSLYAPFGVDVRVGGFESATLAEGTFDLVLSNVPFGRYGVLDNRNRPYSRASIHNWFVGRALDVLRPGGLVCFITSSYFLDENDAGVRAHVASEADLITAFRLPAGTFERLASTSVQADLVVLRKRAPGEAAAAAEWLDLDYVPKAMLRSGCHEQYLRINRWFVQHPEHVLGRIDRVSNGYQAVPTAVLEGDLEAALLNAQTMVPKGIYGARPTAPCKEPRNVVSAPAGARPGSFVVHDGRIGIVEGDHVVDVHDRLNATVRLRIAGMADIRDRARALLSAQLGTASDLDLGDLRRRLNQSYDRFVTRQGYLSCRANALAFRRDPDYPLLLSLEHYDEEEDAATKAAIFTKRTVSPIREATHADHPDEALALSMQWKGRVDPDYIGQLLRAAPSEALEDLTARGMVYLNPEGDRYEPADEYLSGNVKRKLTSALAAGDAYQANVAALEKVIPEDLPPGDIALRLGAVWVPADVVEAFIKEVLGLQDTSVRYLAVAGTWSVTFNDWAARQSVACIQEYGTRRMHAIELVQHALNVQTPTVRDPHPEKDGVYVVNKEETLAAREKLGLIRDRFAAWAYEDAARRERLCRIYNDLFVRREVA